MNDPSAPSTPFYRWSRIILAVFFIGAGVSHFVMPAFFTGIVPQWLPNPMLLVRISGVAEIFGGAGLLIPRTRQAAGWGLIALLIAVFPANVNMLHMALSDGSSMGRQAALWLRLPIQPVLIWWVWRVAIRTRQRSPAYTTNPFI